MTFYFGETNDRISVADEKFMNQISRSSLRTIKASIELNDEIQFSIVEIEEIVTNIKAFIREISKKLIALTD
jgi:hypothetical protein